MHRLTALREAVAKTAAKDMTGPQIKIYEKLSDAARRLFNDLAKYPKYQGGASGEAALLELSKTKLLTLLHRNPGKMPLAILTRRGKQMAQRLVGSGRLAQIQAADSKAPKPKKLDRSTKMRGTHSSRSASTLRPRPATCSRATRAAAAWTSSGPTPATMLSCPALRSPTPSSSSPGTSWRTTSLKCSAT